MATILSCDRCGTLDGLKMIQTRGSLEGNIYLCWKCRSGLVVDRETQLLRTFANGEKE